MWRAVMVHFCQTTPGVVHTDGARPQHRHDKAEGTWRRAKAAGGQPWPRMSRERCHYPKGRGRPDPTAHPVSHLPESPVHLPVTSPVPFISFCPWGLPFCKTSYVTCSRTDLWLADRTSCLFLSTSERRQSRMLLPMIYLETQFFYVIPHMFAYFSVMGWLPLFWKCHTTLWLAAHFLWARKCSYKYIV